MFALRLKELRENKGLSQKQLANKLDVSQSTVGMWESQKREPNFSTTEKIANFFGVSIDYLLDNTTSANTPTKIKIPVLGRVAAGIPIEAVEEIIGYEEISFKEFNAEYDYFGLVIKGDSMKPRMQSGDVVIVRKQETAESGDIAVVLVNGNEATVKKIKIGTDGLMLIPLNQEYEVMMYNNEEIESLPVSIIGKVVELRAKF